MKVLWLDDHARDPDSLAALLSEWDFDRADVLPATDLREARQILQSGANIRLIILDLLWGDEPENPATNATGIACLATLRKEYPGLLIATRSRVRKPAALAAFIHEFVRHRVADHFVIGDTSPQVAFRRNLVLERAAAAQQEMGLSAFLGEQWGAVMFADISGFTTMTEKLWGANRAKLTSTLLEFYREACDVVAGKGGVVDKLIGDEVMAVFPAASTDARRSAATNCVDAAAEISARFLTVERNFKRDLIDITDDVGSPKWQLKIGIEAGSLLIAQHVLPHGEPEYCTIGFAVNVAARIKGLSGPYTITLGPTIQPWLPQASIYATQRFSEETLLTGFGRPLWLYTLQESPVLEHAKGASQ
jgi:class 3 adenylate cyclase